MIKQNKRNKVSKSKQDIVTLHVSAPDEQGGGGLYVEFTKESINKYNDIHSIFTGNWTVLQLQRRCQKFHTLETAGFLGVEESTKESSNCYCLRVGKNKYNGHYYNKVTEIYRPIR